MRGLGATPMENQDQFLSGEITNHLFEERRIPFSGLDLAALNIQRGRDHGLRPYNEYRVACNLDRANSFDDLSKEISFDVIKRLRQVLFYEKLLMFGFSNLLKYCFINAGLR